MTGYTVMREPPLKRRGKHSGSHEEHFPEASVMLAFAMHLIELGARSVQIHPDGEHAKRHDIRGWLVSQGFTCEALDSQRCVGRYKRADHVIDVDMRPGMGDVEATVRDIRVLAECKGGIINTWHRGQVSRLRKGLCEAVGQLLSRQVADAERHIAVVPDTTVTAALAGRMAARCLSAGVGIALVKRDGEVVYATSSLSDALASEPTARKFII